MFVYLLTRLRKVLFPAAMFPSIEIFRGPILPMCSMVLFNIHFVIYNTLIYVT